MLHIKNHAEYDATALYTLYAGHDRPVMMDAESLVAGDRQRRMHTKSRNGCMQCKKRHVKVSTPCFPFAGYSHSDTMTQCDEQRPLCGRCVKTSQKCSLSLPAPSEHTCNCSQRPILPSNTSFYSHRANVDHVAIQNLRIFSEQMYQPPLLATSSLEYQPLPMGDMELLHSSLREGQALGLDADHDIKLGFSSPYLLHIILGLSALRLYDRQPMRMDLLSRASRHQDRALALVRPHLADLNQSNIHAVLRFAFLVSIVALGQPLYRPSGRSQYGEDSIDHLLHSFNMVRGVKFVTERQWQLSGEATMGDGPCLDDDDPLQQGLRGKFPQYYAVRDLVARTCKVESERLVCLDAIRKVFSFIDLIESYPQLHPQARLIQIWPIELDQRFIAMMSARRPIALLILGFYTALLKLRSGTAWPFVAWPKLVLRRVMKVLGREWTVHLRWAIDRVLWENPYPDSPAFGSENYAYL